MPRRRGRNNLRNRKRTTMKNYLSTILYLVIAIQLMCLFAFLETSLSRWMKEKDKTETKWFPHSFHPDVHRISTLGELDNDLLIFIKEHHIFSPPNEGIGITNLKDKKYGKDEDGRVSRYLGEVFEKQPQGFFFETGASDGFYSHTLLLERELGWTGLLSECNPAFFAALKAARRNAFITDLCLSKQSQALVSNLTLIKLHPPLENVARDYPKTFEAHTVPISSLLLAMDLKTVDVIVLAAQGIYFDILKKFPFEQIKVKAWVIDTSFFRPVVKKELPKFMWNKMYTRFNTIKQYFIFVHQSLVPL